MGLRYLWTQDLWISESMGSKPADLDPLRILRIDSKKQEGILMPNVGILRAGEVYVASLALRKSSGPNQSSGQPTRPTWNSRVSPNLEPADFIY